MSIGSTVLQLIVTAGTGELEQIATTTGRTRKSIVKVVQTLKGLGYIAVCDDLDKAMGSLARGMYVATAAGVAFAARGEEIKPGKAGERPRQRTFGLRERAWWHFRAHKVATLEAAGILKRLPMKQAARQSKGRVVWTLAKDLGLQAPVWRQKAGEIYDPNGDAVFVMAKKGGE